MCKAIEDMIKDGEVRGEARGKAQGEVYGESRLATLTQRLLKDGRMDALELAMADRDYRIQLYEEYQID